MQRSVRGVLRRNSISFLYNDRVSSHSELTADVLKLIKTELLKYIVFEKHISKYISDEANDVTVNI